jgi:hypothetical protein
MTRTSSRWVSSCLRQMSRKSLSGDPRRPVKVARVQSSAGTEACLKRSRSCTSSTITCVTCLRSAQRRAGGCQGNKTCPGREHLRNADRPPAWVGGGDAQQEAGGAEEEMRGLGHLALQPHIIANRFPCHPLVASVQSIPGGRRSVPLARLHPLQPLTQSAAPLLSDAAGHRDGGDATRLSADNRARPSPAGKTRGGGGGLRAVGNRNGFGGPG